MARRANKKGVMPSAGTARMMRRARLLQDRTDRLRGLLLV